VAGAVASWPDVVAGLTRVGVTVDVVPPLFEQIGLGAAVLAGIEGALWDLVGKVVVGVAVGSSLGTAATNPPQ